MAASRGQGSYLALFWTTITVFCAGLAFFGEGLGKVVLLIGLVGIVMSLVGFMKQKALEGATGSLPGKPAMKLVGILVTWGGWLVTVVGLHLSSSVTGRIGLAVIGIAVSLVGIIGILPTAFGRSMIGKAQSSSFVAAKTSMEHSR